VTARFRNGWILSPAGDLLVFAGPVAVAGALILAFSAAGALDAELPPWAFALLVVGCDVAHVYATAFRTYLDPVERARRPGLYVGVPLACFVGGVALHLYDGAVFWRALAYLAAFHFVRQQYGWMAYAARKAGETSRLDRVLDRVAIDNATLFPLLWWHAHLPRTFAWFLPGDFVEGLPASVGDVGLWVHGGINAAYLGRQAWLLASGRGVNLAKLLVWSTTWLAWFGGIVVLDSDLAFTATNVLAHGVPYLVVVHGWGRSRWSGEGAPVGRLFRPGGAVLYYAALVGAAALEEGLWDRLVWHEHGGLFPGPAVTLGAAALSVVVPLLALPQAVHYVLDAFLWRTGARNPGLAEHLGFPRAR
jgi:hypothetical protein